MATSQVAQTPKEKTSFWKEYGSGGSRFIALLALIFLWYSDSSIFDQWRFSPKPLSSLISAIKDEKVSKLSVSDREIRAFYKTGERARITKEPHVSLSETLRPYNLNGSFEKIAVDYNGTSFFYDVLRRLIMLALAWYSIFRPLSKTIDLIIENAPSGGLASKKNQKKETGLKTTLADVAGIAPVKAELNEIVDFLKNPEKYKKIGARIPRGVLLSGPPGVGKTLLARAIAGEAQASFFNMNGSEFIELYVGMGARRVRELFEQARKAGPSIIFIDEIDAIAGSRGYAGGSEERLQTLNQLLVEMDGFDTDNNTIVMAATNRPEALDGAIMRPGRFDRRIHVPLPNREEREAILKLRAKDRTLDRHVKLDKIAERTSGFSGADLDKLINEAAFLAIRANEATITQAHLLESIDKLELGLKHDRPPTAEERRRTAIHEAGHAIVAVKFAGERVQRISLVGRGDAGGFTRSSFTESDNPTMTLKMLTGRLAVLMGGYAAEKQKYDADQISTGLSHDLKQTTRIARTMVKHFGMGKGTGLLTVTANSSAKIRETADEDARKLVDQAVTNATSTLVDNQNVFNKLVEELLAKEALEEDQIRAILG